MQPKISIILPTYNCINYLPTTINSILSQTYENFEIIVVDDCSTDTTESYISNIKDTRIIYHKLDKNHGGPSKPRNVGIAKSRGELICLFDSDDIMLQDKLKIAVEMLDDHPTINFIFSDALRINEYGEVYPGTLLKHYDIFRSKINEISDNCFVISALDAYDTLLYENFIPTSSVVLRRTLLGDIGVFDESLMNSDDRDMWWRISRNNDMGFIDIPLHQYRIREKSVSKRGFLTAFNRIKVIEKQLSYSLTERQKKQAQKLLSENYFGIGFLHRKQNRYKESLSYYVKSFKLYPSFLTVKAAVVAFILMNISFLKMKKCRMNS